MVRRKTTLWPSWRRWQDTPQRSGCSNVPFHNCRDEWYFWGPDVFLVPSDGKLLEQHSFWVVCEIFIANRAMRLSFIEVWRKCGNGAGLGTIEFGQLRAAWVHGVRRNADGWTSGLLYRESHKDLSAPHCIILQSSDARADRLRRALHITFVGGESFFRVIHCWELTVDAGSS